MEVNELFPALAAFTWKQVIMIVIGLVLIYLAIAKEYEPMLLLPIGFGALLANIPFTSALTQIDPKTGQAVEGVLSLFYQAGIATEIFPLLIFIAIGAMIDFTPLFQRPQLLLFGAAAQFGIFFTMLVATLMGFDLKEAASIGIIGAADGPTSIFVASRFAPNLLWRISVSAYSYMARVPLIQPPVIRLLTSRKERLIKMPTTSRLVSKTALIAFPIIVTLIAGIIAPSSLSLIGFLMFGNLIRECGVLNKLSQSAQNELSSLVTLLLGITIASTMTAEKFVNVDTLFIICLGLIAFIFDTVGGVLFAKVMNLFLPKGKKINPMVGACGISAFPMSARVIYKMGQKEDPTNYLLMPAVSANVAGQIGSVVAGGILLTLVGLMA
jgi:oxaloacetate decarboxylase beta subunit